MSLHVSILVTPDIVFMAPNSDGLKYPFGFFFYAEMGVIGI